MEILTEMTWAIAERTANAPNKDPTSELRPLACKHTAPSECKVGFPPEVKDDRVEKATKAGCEDDGTIATSASADASTNSEA